MDWMTIQGPFQPKLSYDPVLEQYLGRAESGLLLGVNLCVPPESHNQEQRGSSGLCLE